MSDLSAGRLSIDQAAILLGGAPNHVNAEIEACVDKYWNMALENVGKLGKLVKPTVTYDLKGRTGGRAWTWPNNAKPPKLQLNGALMMANLDYYLKQTVPHEVAHSVQKQLWFGSQSHGYEWKYIMQIFGVPALRTHSLPTTPARKTRKFRYHCNCRSHVMGLTRHKRHQLGADYYCPLCGGSLRGGTEIK